MTDFEPGRIRNETVRAHYERALRRGGYMASEMVDAYGSDRAPIRMSFIDEDAFNAYARFDDGAYLIELGKPVPLLLILLFEKLLSEPRLFPWIDAAGSIVESYEVSFIIDPVDFAGRKPWDVSLTAGRSFAASMLADIMVAFIQMHELGHVLCGHVEAHRRLTGGLRMAEILEDEPISRGRLERERAWEADADSVAATFLADHIAQLAREARRDEAARAVFGRGERTIEHITSVVIVSLWAMFAYFRGARYRLGRRSSHPHPLVRTYYIKDMLITAARRKLLLDLDVLLGLIDERLEEMLVALEAVGLSKNHLFDDRYVDRVEREVARLVSSRRRHRRSCSPWAWFSWTESRATRS